MWKLLWPRHFGTRCVCTGNRKVVNMWFSASTNDEYPNNQILSNTEHISHLKRPWGPGKLHSSYIAYIAYCAVCVCVCYCCTASKSIPLPACFPFHFKHLRLPCSRVFAAGGVVSPTSAGTPAGDTSPTYGTYTGAGTHINKAHTHGHAHFPLAFIPVSDIYFSPSLSRLLASRPPERLAKRPICFPLFSSPVSNWLEGIWGDLQRVELENKDPPPTHTYTPSLYLSLCKWTKITAKHINPPVDDTLSPITGFVYSLVYQISTSKEVTKTWRFDLLP